MADKKDKKSAEQKLLTIHERHKKAVDADRDNRRKAIEDLRFTHVPGEQWDLNARAARGDRICPEFNKLRVTIKRVVNDMRANRPQGKVRGVEETDKPTAEIYEGLIRNIWTVSDGDTVIDQAAEYQVGGGMGAWRVSVDYASDGAWEQDIKIEGIENPFCLYCDPNSKDPMKRDAEYWFLTSKMSKEAFEAAYPKKEVVSFENENEFDDEEEWEDDDSVRIVEYWYKEPVKKTSYLLADGRTVDQPDPNVPAVKQRNYMGYVIKMCIASGDAILEESDWAGTMFPFIMIHGEYVVIEGKRHWFGLPRFGKDAQKAYNYERAAAMEAVANTSRAKFWATPKQAEGLTEQWARAHNENLPFQLANVDPMMAGFPQAMPPPTIPAALFALAQMSSEDIKSVTGIFDASLGKNGNETSGVAINARQAQAEIAVFNYMDNLSKGIRRTWEILVDLIPQIYDTQRNLRILGVDGAEKYAKVNGIDPMTGEAYPDLARGKYDVSVTVGPSFSNQREQAAEVYMGMAQANPAVFPIAGDLIFKSLDLPYSDQIAERLKTLLPPQIQQMEAGGKGMPPEVAQGMMQVDQAMQQVQMMAQQMEKDSQGVERGQAELQKQMSDLEVKKAQFDAHVAKTLAQVQLAKADFVVQQAESGADEKGKKNEQKINDDRQKLGEQVTEAITAIQQQSNDMLAQILQVIAEIQAKSQPQVVVADPPKTKHAVIKLPSGKTASAVITEEA